MRYVALVLALLLLPVASKAWVYEGWKYRTCFEIREIGGYSLDNYIVELKMNTEALIKSEKMNPDCSDIRVAIGNKSVEYFFVECNTTNTRIFFPITLKPYERKEGCIYYGNTQAFDERNISIFPWYDSFEDEALTEQRGWNLLKCKRTPSDSYDFSWSLMCSGEGAKASVSVTGNYVCFAYRAIPKRDSHLSFYSNETLILEVTPSEWTVYCTNFTGSELRWEGKNFYLDTVFTRATVQPEPVVKVKPEIVYGKSVTYLKTYCEDSYVVNELIECSLTDGVWLCETNKTLIYCEYGCWEGKCNPSPFKRSVYILGVLIGLLFLFVIIWRVVR